jgi:hypothetical protein
MGSFLEPFFFDFGRIWLADDFGRDGVKTCKIGSNLNPKACTPIELRRVGVVFTRRKQSFKCLQCGAAWTITGWLNKRPRNYWVCPNGCNAPASRSDSEQASPQLS